MTETDEKPGKRRPVKQGLHGWKAALAIFGCGSLAAFGVFGVLALLLTSIFSFSSSGLQGNESGEGAAPESIGEPRASIEPGDLDVCSRNIEASGSLNVTRVDAGGNFEDPGDGGSRVVRDQCDWELIPDVNSTSNWDFSYEYEAFISASGASRDDLASQEFDARAESFPGEFYDVSSQGSENLADRSYYAFGEVSPGVPGYCLVAQTRSAVYEIRLSVEGGDGENESVSRESMKHEAEKVIDVSDIEFKIWIPDE